MWKHFWGDESGSVNSAELVLIMTLMSIGTLVGMKSFRDSAVTEFADLAQALANLDQSYSQAAITVTLPGGGTVETTAFGFEDAPDFCDSQGSVQHEQTTPGSKCILVAEPASSSVTGGETGGPS